MSQITVPVHGTARLVLPEDWTDWNNGFQALSYAKGLGEYVKPGSTRELLTEPEPPRITTKYSITKKAKERINGARVLREEAEGSETTTQSDAEVLTTGDLDADGLKAFQIDLQLYRDALAKYTKEDEAVTSMKTWVLNTVSVHWRTTACQPTETLPAWHRKLEEHVGITEERLQDHLGEHYRKVLNTRGGRVSNWETWIQDWERALNAAREKNVPEATHAPTWFRQLLTALVHYHKHWTTSYRMLNQT